MMNTMSIMNCASRGIQFADLRIEGVQVNDTDAALNLNNTADYKYQVQAIKTSKEQDKT